jgi:hypothetical protein
MEGGLLKQYLGLEIRSAYIISDIFCQSVLYKV